MELRSARKEDAFGLNLSESAMISDDEFTVDGFDGAYAISDVNEEPTVVIGWMEGEEPREVQFDVPDQTTGNLVLASLGCELSLQALRAMGFYHVL